MTSRSRLASAGVVAMLLAGGAGAQDDASRARQAVARAAALEAQGNDAAALPLLWEAAGLAPRDAEIQDRLGDALARLGALDAAAEAFRRALQARPDFHKASNSLVLTLVQAGRGADAIAHARQALARAPADAERRFTLGLALSDQDVDAAVTTFRDVLRVAPRHALARYNLALVLQRTDRLAEAADELGRAIAIEPRPEALYALGVVHWHLGNAGQALAALEAAIDAAPDYVAALHTRGVVMSQQGDLAGAIASVRRAVALRPDLAAAQLTLARLLQQAGDDAAAARARAAGERMRQGAEREREALVWTAVGTAKFDRGELIGALDDFRRATRIAGEYAPAHYQLGRTLLALGEPDAARAAFDRAHQLNPALVAPSDRR